jgi:DNA-directed RNA polymerase subunit RPC12/RpoP
VRKRLAMKKEMKNLHLVNQQGRVRAVICLTCSSCKKEHPASPSALEWFKLQLQKNKLKCPYCGSKVFHRTRSKASQGELISEMVANRTKVTKRQIEDQVGSESEGRSYTKKFGVKYV